MLEYLISASNIILLLSFIFIPLILLRKLKILEGKFLKVKFTFYVLLICFVLSILTAFWKDYSSEILLRSYNAYEYNPDLGNEQVEYKNVEPENLQRVKRLEQTIMGIGWPLRAIFLFVFSLLPVFLFTIIANEITEKIVLRNRNKLLKGNKL